MGMGRTSDGTREWGEGVGEKEEVRVNSLEKRWMKLRWTLGQGI